MDRVRYSQVEIAVRCPWHRGPGWISLGRMAHSRHRIAERYSLRSALFFELARRTHLLFRVAARLSSGNGMGLRPQREPALGDGDAHEFGSQQYHLWSRLGTRNDEPVLHCRAVGRSVDCHCGKFRCRSKAPPGACSTRIAPSTEAVIRVHGAAKRAAFNRLWRVAPSPISGVPQRDG